MIRFSFILLLFVSTNISSQTTNLKLASDIWPPFTNVETEKSLAIDIVTEALARTEIGSTYEIVDFGKLMSNLKDGSYNGSAALWRNTEREEWLMYSDAYMENQLILVGQKDSEIDFVSFSEIKNKKIGAVKGYAYGKELTDARDIEIVYGGSDQQNLESLLSSKVDYILVDAILIQYLLKYQLNDVSELLEIGKAPMISKTLHFALRKDLPDAEKIVEGFNTEIKTMISDGTYNEILEFNWIRADVDGDGNTELVLIGDKAGKEAPNQVYSIYNTPAAKGDNRYYIEGEVYDGWNNIPERYKKDAMQGAGPSPSQIGFRL